MAGGSRARDANGVDAELPGEIDPALAIIVDVSHLGFGASLAAHVPSGVAQTYHCPPVPNNPTLRRARLACLGDLTLDIVVRASAPVAAGTDVPASISFRVGG